jgi:hypothetical protein
LENLKRRHHLEDLGIDGRIILKYVSKMRGRGDRLDLSGSGHEPVAGSCE